MGRFYQREVNQAVDTIVALIEPVMIIVLGLGLVYCLFLYCYLFIVCLQGCKVIHIYNINNFEIIINGIIKSYSF